jgi:hypothetical protein
MLVYHPPPPPLLLLLSLLLLLAALCAQSEELLCWPAAASLTGPADHLRWPVGDLTDSLMPHAAAAAAVVALQAQTSLLLVR